jgi:hypothetical protein
MKTYTVKTRFSFTGKFFIKAACKAEAKEQVMNACSLVIREGIHTSLQEEQVHWDFPIHPDKQIISIREKGKPTDEK